MENGKVALEMITIHGLRALAVANERAEQARLQGDAEALSRWQNVQAAVNELRRTLPSRT
jgi:hypothetical protein